jgi:tetratricopeptide (TPR) repeat protein
MLPNRSHANRSEQSAGAYRFGPAPRQVSGTIAIDPRARPPLRERQASGPVARNRAADKRSALSDALTQSIARRRYGDALACIMQLATLEPAEPRWHQKYGEVLRTLGRTKEAAAAYRRAARRYEAMALPARASALSRVAEQLEGASAPTPPARTSTDRLRLQPFVPTEDRVTVRPPTRE